MILAQIKTPFVCDQGTVLTTSFLDSAAGHKSIFLFSDRYIQTDIPE